MNDLNQKGFFSHIHLPHGHGIIQQLFYDERFWTVISIIALLAVLILLAILAPPIENPIKHLLNWKHLPGCPLAP